MSATISTEFVFKAQKEDEIRRLVVAHPCLADVSAAIAERFTLTSPFSLSYSNEDNEIFTVESDEDLLKALSVLPLGKTLKLLIGDTQPACSPDLSLPVEEETMMINPERELVTPVKCPCTKHCLMKRSQTSFLEGNKMPIITEPGTDHRVSLHVENKGDCPWPENTYFRFVRGENFFTQTSSVLVNNGASVQPGETVTIELSFTAPTEFGRHAAVWRMSIVPQPHSVDKPAQGCFGSPVRIVAIVRRQPNQHLKTKMEKRLSRLALGGEAQGCRHAKRKERLAELEALRAKYSSQLDTIKGAGLQAKEGCLLRMLNKFEGDAQLVITRLQKRRGAFKSTV